MPPRMGQNVTVVAKKSSNPKVLRFEINRSLTGMGHERYGSLADIVRERPVDELARRLFTHGGVDYLHVNSSVITVHLSGGSVGEGLADVIANLFRFYGDEPEVVDATGPDTDVVEPDAALAPEVAADDAARAEGTPQTAEDAPAPVDNEPEPEASTDHFPDDDSETSVTS